MLIIGPKYCQSLFANSKNASGFIILKMGPTIVMIVNTMVDDNEYWWSSSPLPTQVGPFTGKSLSTISKVCLDFMTIT